MGCIDATTENSEFAIYKHKNEDAILPDLLAEASTASQFCQEQSLSLFFFKQQASLLFVSLVAKKRIENTISTYKKLY